MPLVVVPLSPEETGQLTLGELDALRSCERVLFERPDHPLMGRLLEEGIEAGPFDDEPEASRDGWALVADPGSPRVLELAREGAVVTSGPATPPDVLSAAHAAPLVRRAAASLATLCSVMARLRSDDGCPWDREQTHESLVAHLLEETYEVIDSVERGELGLGLKEELGDVLLQVAFHSRLAQQDGRFDLAGVADVITAKLLRRHPHVFGDVEVSGAPEVLANWEAIKATEKARTDVFDDIPASLPALLEATKTQKRAAREGFSPEGRNARRAVGDALGGDVGDGELGEALFWLVALARSRGIDPEMALRRRTAAFRDEHRPSERAT